MSDEYTVESALQEVLSISRATVGQKRVEFSDQQFELLGDTFLNRELREPKRCVAQGCSATCSVRREKDEFVVCCDLEEHPHERRLDVNEYEYYSLDFQSILERVAGQLEYDLAKDTYNETELPRFVSIRTEDGLKIVLLLDLNDPTQTVTSIYTETLREDRPTLLITPDQNIEPLLEVQSLFVVGSLIYTIPLSILSEEAEYVRAPVDTLFDIKQLEREFIENRHGSDPDPVVTRVNSNPRYALSELNHMRLLRKNKELSGNDGTRLEKTAAACLAHLFPTHLGEGGEEQRGSGVPDKLFYIPAVNDEHEVKCESILGIVDSKSGDEADFGSEEARGKHDEYLDPASGESVSGDRIAHTFVILDFDGHQELEFFDKMRDFYRDQDFMLIITADAFAVLLAGYLAVNVSNELQLIYGSFREAIYPLFHPRLFREQGLKSISRPVGKDDDRYRDRYQQRESLVILHRGVVKKHLQDCLKSPKEIENVFQQYLAPSPQI